MIKKGMKQTLAKTDKQPNINEQLAGLERYLPSNTMTKVYSIFSSFMNRYEGSLKEEHKSPPRFPLESVVKTAFDYTDLNSLFNEDNYADPFMHMVEIQLIVLSDFCDYKIGTYSIIGSVVSHASGDKPKEQFSFYFCEDNIMGILSTDDDSKRVTLAFNSMTGKPYVLKDFLTMYNKLEEAIDTAKNIRMH